MEISAVQNLILRIMAFVLLLISLIIMAEDKTTSDLLFSVSFSGFEAFRFVVAANVLGCVYSFIRIILALRGTIKAFCFYLSFILDQVMTYLLLSSASAGIAYIMLIRDSLQGQEAYGVAEKKFLRLASASVSMEFLGFLVMAASAVISAYNLFCYLCSQPINTVPTPNIDTQGAPAPNIDTKHQGSGDVLFDLCLEYKN